MKRIFVPTQSGSDWQRLLGKPKLHWKKGYSAMSAAACWEDNHPHLPTEIMAILHSANIPALANLDLLMAIPEWEVDLPGGDRPSQTDILALTRNDEGLVVLGVEAKVEEPFGPTLAEKKKGASQGQLKRIHYLESELGKTEGFSGHIRYQLLHRSISALLTARAFHAPVAVMLVHSFSKTSSWRDEFLTFCEELDCKQITNNIFLVSGVSDRQLYLGWCKGNEKYLEIELPSVL
ncbi:MAG: hypothetical protein KDI30_10675 [Pseudomonadales bacterium]|nr:hypothetical protein [Pseudomonadales bacterium]